MLAEFIDEGHFARHIRRMRMLYGERADALVDSSAKYLAGALTVMKPQAGMHTIGWLVDGASDRAVSRRAGESGVFTWSLSACYRQNEDPKPQSGLILGFAPYSEAAICDAVRALATVLDRR